MMTTGPTTLNGPLHSDDASVSDRRITAYFGSAAEARGTRDALVAAGIPTGCITVTEARADAAALAPADDSIVGRIREAVLPEDSERATREAVRNGEFTLTVLPEGDAVDRVVDIIQAGKPSHFDAGLERWRNAPPGA